MPIAPQNTNKPINVTYDSGSKDCKGEIEEDERTEGDQGAATLDHGQSPLRGCVWGVGMGRHPFWEVPKP